MILGTYFQMTQGEKKHTHTATHEQGEKANTAKG